VSIVSDLKQAGYKETFCKREPVAQRQFVLSGALSRCSGIRPTVKPENGSMSNNRQFIRFGFQIKRLWHITNVEKGLGKPVKTSKRLKNQ